MRVLSKYTELPLQKVWRPHKKSCNISYSRTKLLSFFESFISPRGFNRECEGKFEYTTGYRSPMIFQPWRRQTAWTLLSLAVCISKAIFQTSSILRENSIFMLLTPPQIIKTKYLPTSIYEVFEDSKSTFI